MVFRKKQKSAFEHVLILSVIMMLGMLVLFTWLTESETDKFELVDVETYEIEALKDNMSLQGDYYLGSGQSEEIMNYYYMSKEDDGSMKMRNSSVDDSKIFTVEDEKEIRVEIKEKKYDNIIRQIFLNTEYEYHYYIPKGSISNEYKVDLE